MPEEAPASAAPADPAVPNLEIGPKGLSADAKLETFESLQLDLEAGRHAADGAGRAWLTAVEEAGDDLAFAPAKTDAAGTPMLRANGRGRFRIVYQAGPLGVALGGAVFLQASPFWDWDDPQVSFVEAPGYTEVETDAEGVELAPVELGQGLLAIPIEGRALAVGEQIRITYGAGPLGAGVDDYAEQGARLWIAVDGDGDGIRAVVEDSPAVRIVARDAAQIVLTVQTTASPGDPVKLTAAVLDVVGNAGVPYTGQLAILESPGLELPESITFEPGDHGHITVSGRALEAGIYRIRARGTGELAGLEVESNPLVVRAGIAQVLWGDLHGHSNLSDGTGTPSDYFEYARDVAALDVVALTDHDHWGMRFIDMRPALWQHIRDETKRFHEAGRFVTVLGYEWTSWLQGHRHVLYFADDGELLSSVDQRYQTPAQLWSALEGKPALTFAHHSAGGPVSTNWNFAPPPTLEPITEIASVHGSSEAPDSPGLIYDPVPGNFVRDVLSAGYRFGFIGSGDSHDGHPGLAHLGSSRMGGLAAIRAEERTRDAVLAALRARQTYATNGRRIYLEVQLQDGPTRYPMGSTIPSPTELVPPKTQTLHVEIAASGVIGTIDFIRSGLTAQIAGDGRRDWEGEREIPRLAPGEYVYVRVVETDGSTAAWSSPIYAD